MDININQRLRDFLHYLNISESEFSRQLGYSSPEKISRLTRKDDLKPSYAIIFDIANKFGNILNIEWLILGTGKMLKDAENDINNISEPGIEYKPNTLYSRENALLRDYLDDMKSIVSDLRDYIKLLKSK